MIVMIIPVHTLRTFFPYLLMLHKSPKRGSLMQQRNNCRKVLMWPQLIVSCITISKAFSPPASHSISVFPFILMMMVMMLLLILTSWSLVIVILKGETECQRVRAADVFPHLFNHFLLSIHAMPDISIYSLSIFCVSSTRDQVSCYIHITCINIITMIVPFHLNYCLGSLRWGE